MASRKDLIEAKRRDLESKGYRPGIIKKALDWAVGSADGMSSHFSEEGNDRDLSDQLLPGYLNDCENWIKSIVGEPPQQPPKD